MKKLFNVLSLLGIILLVGVIFSGYYLFFCNAGGSHELTVDRLNAFYASLFTAIAVIVALAALLSWSSYKEKMNELRKENEELKKSFNIYKNELQEKLEKFKEFEDKVNFVIEKKELAEWVQKLFDKDNDKKIFSKLSLLISDEDKKKLDDVKKNVLEETTEDNWLKLIYAHELLDDDAKTDKEKIFKKAEKIYKYIENRDLCKEDSELRHILLQLMGLMYWNWYKFRKEKFMSKEFEKKKNPKWFQEWINNSDNCEFLNKAETYYKEAFEELEERKTNKDETLRNLAIVLIEKSKFDTPEEAGKKLKKAEGNLDDVIEKTYNDYWDRARILFYLDRKKYSDRIKNLLLEDVVREIDNLEDKKFFIKYLKKEIEEKDRNGNTGFPGDEGLYKEILGSLKDC